MSQEQQLETVIEKLKKLGPMPSEYSVDVEVVNKYEGLIHQIRTPLKDSEVEILIGLFGPDSFYGLAWTVVSLIETAPNWIMKVSRINSENEWVQILKSRAKKN